MPPPRGGISPPFTPFACCDFKDSVPPGLPPISPSFPSPPCVAFFVWRIPSQLWHFPVSRVTSASCIPPYLFGSWLPSLLRAPLAGGWGICSGAEAALTNLPPRPPPVAWRRRAARPLPRPAAAWSAEAGEPRPLGAGLALSGRGGGPWLAPARANQREYLPCCGGRGVGPRAGGGLGGWGWDLGPAVAPGAGRRGHQPSQLSLHLFLLVPAELSQIRAPLPSQRMLCTHPYSCIQPRILGMRKSNQPTDRGRKHTLPLIFNWEKSRPWPCDVPHFVSLLSLLRFTTTPRSFIFLSGNSRARGCRIDWVG